MTECLFYVVPREDLFGRKQSFYQGPVTGRNQAIKSEVRPAGARDSRDLCLSRNRLDVLSDSSQVGREAGRGVPRSGRASGQASPTTPSPGSLGKRSLRRNY